MAPRGPHWVHAILDWRWTWACARTLLTSGYVLGGMTKLLNFQAAVAEQQHLGLYPGVLWATVTIAIELGGSALIISGRFVWFGAGALGVLTAVASVVANNFWDLGGKARFMAMNSFFEHIGLIAGFVLAALQAEHEKTQAHTEILCAATTPGIP